MLEPVSGNWKTETAQMRHGLLAGVRSHGLGNPDQAIAALRIAQEEHASSLLFVLTNNPLFEAGQDDPASSS